MDLETRQSQKDHHPLINILYDKTKENPFIKWYWLNWIEQKSFGGINRQILWAFARNTDVEPVQVILHWKNNVVGWKISISLCKHNPKRTGQPNHLDSQPWGQRIRRPNQALKTRELTPKVRDVLFHTNQQKSRQRSRLAQRKTKIAILITRKPALRPNIKNKLKPDPATHPAT